MKAKFTITVEANGKQYIEQFHNHLLKMASEATERWGFTLDVEREELDE